MLHIFRSRRARAAGGAGALVVAAAGAAVLCFAEPPDERPCVAADRLLLAAPDAGRSTVTGRLLAANQFSETATIVTLATGEVTELDAGSGPHEAAVSPDGRWGVVTNYGDRIRGGFDGDRIFVVDMAGGRIARVIRTGLRGLHGVAFRPGHPTRVLVTAQTDRRVLEVDVETGKVLGAIDTRGDRSHLLAVTGDGSTVFTTNEGTADISRLDVATRSFVAAFPASAGVEGIAVAGGELWVGEPSRGVVTVRNAESGTVLATLPGFRHPVRIRASPGGERVVISDPGCRIIAIGDPATRRLVSVIGTGKLAPVMVGDVAPDGRTAFASASDEREVLVLDLEGATVLARHRAGWHPDGVAWGP